MTRYTVTVDRPAQKQLRAVKDVRLRNALEREIMALADDPRPPGCLKLVGHKHHWRVRVGDWRIVYRTLDGRLVVVVVRVAPRGGGGSGGLAPTLLLDRRGGQSASPRSPTPQTAAR